MTPFGSTRERDVQDALRMQGPPAAVALLFGAGLAVLAEIGATALLLGVAVTQGVLVLSWVVGTAMPGRIGGIVLGALAAVGADLAVSRFPSGQLGSLLFVAGLALPAMFIHQLTRGVVRTRVVESLSDIALLVVCVLALAALPQLRHETGGAAMTSAVLAAATTALVLGHLVDTVWSAPRWDPAVPRGLPAVIAGVAGAATASYLRLHGTVEFTASRAALVGGMIGAVTGLFAVGAGFIDQATTAPQGRVAVLRPVFAALIPIALSAPVSYLLCLAIRG